MGKLLLEQHLTHLSRMVQSRLITSEEAVSPGKYPVRKADKSQYASFIKKHKCTTEEITILLLALIPHIQPDYFYQIIKIYSPKFEAVPQLGGVKDHTQQFFLPTGETASFILGDGSLSQRFKIQEILSTEHWFAKENILKLDAPKVGEPLLSGKLVLDPEYVELFTAGKISKPVLSTEFPAKYITTVLDWDDLVLPAITLQQIEELKHWVNHHATLMEGWKMEGKLRPGYRALFYGPPGTGKTLTASLLGKATGKDVFRIDLSLVVSKYIGETEKNLSRLFDKATNKNWILFFDEADALFGKRTNVNDAHDKYANQEVSYLLQRIEYFDGLTILASNYRENLDDAFTRRFQSIIYFPFPKPAERMRLWRKAFPDQVDISQLNFQKLSEKFELSGANIMNIVQYICLKLLDAQSTIVTMQMVEQAIYREYKKEGKLV